MNKNLYRIIFNESRGQFMVVGEKAKSKTKGPGISGLCAAGIRPFRGSLKATSLLFAISLLSSPALQAQIVSDTSAPGNQQPIIVQNPNGATIVNIQTPSQAGVSRNQYSRFDVERSGAVLNNAVGNTQTDLAGWVQGNPMLATGSATVILNEVNSTDPSLLNGFIEIAGQRAEVVIANPAGLSCDGCGFINASRSTLTTGRPEFSNGQLNGFSVTGGTIRFAGKGMNDKATDYTRIISRSVEVNAGMWAKSLEVITGTHTVSANGDITQQRRGTQGPEFALDVASLGGMYAGKIHLKGTEEGVGVRNAGTIGASAGELVITAEGELVNSGKITSIQSLTVNTKHALDNRKGTLAARGEVTIEASAINNDDGTLASAGKNLTINSDGLVTSDRGRLEASKKLELAATGLSHQSGIMLADQIDIETRQQHFDNTEGLVRAQNTLTVDTHGNLLINTGSGKDKGFISQGSLTLSTGELNNKTGFIGAAGDLSIDAKDIDNQQGIVLSEASASVKGGYLKNTQGSLQAKSDLTVHQSATTNNSDGLIRSGKKLDLSTSTLTNSHTQADNKGIEGQSLTIRLDALDNRQGAIRADKDLTLSKKSTLDNTDGLISARENLTIQDVPPTSEIRSFGTVPSLVTNTRGTLIANQHLQLTSAQLTGDGKILASGNLSLNLGSDFTNTGILQSDGGLSLASTGLLANHGQILSGQGFNLSAVNVLNTATGEINGQTTTINATGVVTNYGLIDGINTRLQMGTLNNIGTGRIYGDQLYLNSSTLVNREEGGKAAVIAARQALKVGVGTLTNRERALIFSAGSLDLGRQVDQDGQVTGRAGTINNNSATIEALGNAALSVQQLNNTNDHFSTQEKEVSREQIEEYQVSGQPQRYKRDEIRTYNDEVDHLVTPSGTSDSWSLYSYLNIVKEHQVLSSAPGRLLAGENLSLNADNVNNDKSVILAGQDLTGVIGNLTNTSIPGQRTVTQSGTVTHYSRNKKKGRDSQRTSRSDYRPAPIVQNISLAPARYEGNTTPDSTGTQLINRQGSEVTEQASGLSGAVTGLDVAQSSLTKTILSSNSLFLINNSPSATVLIETDPRFTNQRQWLGSDFMLQQLQHDPATTQTRLGDGFYEQQLIREQVSQLTGQRFLAGFASDEEQYRQLMLAGVTFATEQQLRPGVSLSAQQVALLTSDIVWLVERDVTLVDGSTRKVLVPQIYLSPRSGDLSPSGSLIAGNNLQLNLQNDVNNSGTLASRTVTQITADNINNLGGRIRGDDVALTATTDINNIGGEIAAENRLLLQANRDINSLSTTNSTSNSQGTRTHLDRIASLYVGKGANSLLAVTAGNDINLTASRITSASATGETRLNAGNNLTLDTLNTTSRQTIIWDGDNWRKEGQSRDVGSEINVANNLQLGAGNDLNLTAAHVTSELGTVSLAAGNDLTVKEGRSTQFVDEAHKYKGGNGLFSSETTHTRDILNQDRAIGSQLSGENLELLAGQNLNLTGSSAVSTQGTTLRAENMTINAATNRQQQSNFKDVEKSGLFSGGGIGVTIGSQQQTLDTNQQATSLVGSTVGSIKGDVTLLASNDYRQTASDISTPSGNIVVSAKNIAIDAGEQTRKTTEKQRAASPSA